MEDTLGVTVIPRARTAATSRARPSARARRGRRTRGPSRRRGRAPSTRRAPRPARRGAATRAPMCTAMPRTCSPATSHLARVHARAQPRARARARRRGPRPRSGSRAPARRRWPGTRRRRCRSRGRGSARARARTTRVVRVEQRRAIGGRRARPPARSSSTMSVNSTVASTRSGSGPRRTPVRNSSISSHDRGRSPIHGTCIVARKLDESRAGDVLRRCTGPPPRGVAVAGAVHDERRHADRAAARGARRSGVHQDQVARGAGARRGARRVRAHQRRIAASASRDHRVEVGVGCPSPLDLGRDARRSSIVVAHG